MKKQVTKVLDFFDTSAQRREFMGDAHRVDLVVERLAEWLAQSQNKLTPEDLLVLHDIGITLFRERARMQLALSRRRTPKKGKRSGKTTAKRDLAVKRTTRSKAEVIVRTRPSAQLQPS